MVMSKNSVSEAILLQLHNVPKGFIGKDFRRQFAKEIITNCEMHNVSLCFCQFLIQNNSPFLPHSLVLWNVVKKIQVKFQVLLKDKLKYQWLFHTKSF